ncbi:hypothetical protein TEA_004092 [Camellia sinensis var. sinensis]|uniref:YTH domain-containing family protein n=1 Tax=Camellia sinensis var. sinensis TaxID=542762 RepID=A0A4S4EL53_CAMSN|nr:hypothetical protein TEA_004092 [Camellia sinensis var. sinensis]
MLEIEKLEVACSFPPNKRELSSARRTYGASDSLRRGVVGKAHLRQGEARRGARRTYGASDSLRRGVVGKAHLRQGEARPGGSQQPRSFFGFGSGSNSCNRGHLHTDFNQGLGFGSASISSLGTNDRGWLAFDYGRRHGRGDGSLCNCNSALDILSEQNRGPRASKPKSLITNENSASADSNKYSSSTAKTRDESYNCPNFVTEYKDAKFFIIKSYSEDNVHKSIKYGIWASTPNGNRKLDAAYREAKEKNTCPVFLFFSVNASAQFCGVAEMVGPVDFDKSVDYWQQDKWSGQFPVKWHIIRDVPNSQFRHIVLENNDNKPVTNSRDTQEVVTEFSGGSIAMMVVEKLAADGVHDNCVMVMAAKLEQGIEMLKIFNNYESNMSILDDFEFYEDRQKAMQERKARQQQQPSLVVGVGESAGNVVTTTLSSNFIQQISKSFAQVVHLEDYAKEGSDSVSVTERTTGTASDASMTNGHKLENATTVVSSTSKTS